MKIPYVVLFILLLTGCGTDSRKNEQKSGAGALSPLAQEVVEETLRSWQSYKQYAWGHDALAPLTKTYRDWYSEPLYISMIDAYSTLSLMGLEDEAKEIEHWVADSLDFEKDIDVKVFEVNIRILGGLLSMYELSGNRSILEKAQDFGDRMLPAFKTRTGIPRYWVNLESGLAHGDTVNVAEAATYTFEMGILSYYTEDPKYYQAGKEATKAIYARRSDIGLIGDVIDVNTGEWVSDQSHICAGVDSYYEYLYKSYLLFGDPELGAMWNESLPKLHQFLADRYEGRLWYGRVDRKTGKQLSAVVTLYDAFFPAILALSGDTARAADLQASWQWLWDKYGLEPMVYDYRKDTATYPAYDLNPEIIESACYLFRIMKDSSYYVMNEGFWSDLKMHCRTDLAFTSVSDVHSMEKKDYMPTFFFAETLKYLYLTFSDKVDFHSLVFNTEAHPFKKKGFDQEKAKRFLGIILQDIPK